MIQITLIDPEQITSDRGCLVRVIQTILGSNKFTQFHKLYKDLTALKHHHNIQNLFKSVQLKFINKRRLESQSCVYCDLTVKIFSWRQDKLRQQFILLECFPIARHQPNNHHSFTPGTKTLFLSKYFQNCLLAKTFSDTGEDCSSRD